jgi:hypothetical protein
MKFLSCVYLTNLDKTQDYNFTQSNCVMDILLFACFTPAFRDSVVLFLAKIHCKLLKAETTMAKEIKSN